MAAAGLPDPPSRRRKDARINTRTAGGCARGRGSSGRDGRRQRPKHPRVDRPMSSHVVAVFGLGEAGAAIAADLAKTGVEVRGYDPAGVPTPDAVTRVSDPAAAVERANLVMAVTAASDAREAMNQAWVGIDPPMVYADLATAAPGLKKELAAKAAAKDVHFVDVALMAPVPGRGLAVPALASGSGAKRYASLVNDFGGRVEVIGPDAGLASLRKLMRSVVTKGLTALVIEALELAAATGDEDWLWRHIIDELTSMDEGALVRLLEGTARHAGRREAEMEAAHDLLDEVGVPPFMTSGTASALRRIAAEGMPDLAARKWSLP